MRPRIIIIIFAIILLIFMCARSSIRERNTKLVMAPTCGEHVIKMNGDLFGGFLYCPIVGQELIARMIHGKVILSCACVLKTEPKKPDGGVSDSDDEEDDVIQEPTREVWSL